MLGGGIIQIHILLRKEKECMVGNHYSTDD